MNLIRLYTLTHKETHRFMKVFGQTIASPVMIAMMYFLVFGAALSDRIEMENGIPYSFFIVPGLALLQGTVNAFSNASSSMIISKYNGTITDITLPPLTPSEKTLGFALGGIIRGMLVTSVIIGMAFLFLDGFIIQHPFYMLLSLLGINAVFSLLGTLLGIYGKTFDQLSGATTFIITPMGFLGGIFYSLDMLPPLAQTLTKLNPFYYFVENIRWTMFNESSIDPSQSGLLLVCAVFLLYLVTYFSFKKKTLV